MTTTTCGSISPAALPVPVHVVCLGLTVPSAGGLQAALAAARSAGAVQWHVAPADARGAEQPVDIVLCAGAQSVAAAARRWPTAAVIAIVSARDDGSAVVAALDAGAIMGLRHDDITLTAAFVHAVARSRGLVGKQFAR
jgi:hypothetical protein